MRGPVATSPFVSTEIRQNLRLAIPIVLTQLGMMMLGLIDTAIVGRVSEDALAAVALGNMLMFAVSVPAFGFLMAVEPVASQALGEGDRVRAWSTAREALRIAVIATLPVTFLSWLGAVALPWMRVDPAIVPATRAYVYARLPAVFPLYAYIAGKTYQQAAGRPRASVEAVVVANVVHAITGYVAVYGDVALVKVHLPAIGLHAFGAAGAGVATSVSTWLLAAWVWSPRGRPRDGALDYARPGDVRPTGFDRETSRKLVQIGTPIGTQFFAEVAIFSLVTFLMATISARAVAANQIALGLASFSFMGALGVSQATSVRVGMCIGEGSTARARRAGFTGIALGLGYMSAWALIFAVAPHALARLFSSDENVIGAALPLIRLAAIFQIGDAAQVVAGGALRGAGDTRWPLLANLVAHWLIAFPIAWVCAFKLGMGAAGLWWGLVAGLWTIGSALVFRFGSITRREIARV